MKNLLIVWPFWIMIITVVWPLDASNLINHDFSLLDQLEQRNLWNKNSGLRLHLGCGENHLDGYINIDFPLSEHTVQSRSGADVFADITRIKLPRECVDEIRSHHVFEHFDRQTALLLLCQWASWLKVGGKLIIETPDFNGSIELLLNSPLSYTEKQVIMRHIFGSHEASWAIHCDGWYKAKFEHILSCMGFGSIRCELSRYLNLCNITVSAEKHRNLRINELMRRAGYLLRENMVDNTEEPMWKIWCSRLSAVNNTVL